MSASYMLTSNDSAKYFPLRMLGEFLAEGDALLEEQQKRRLDSARNLAKSLSLFERHISVQVDTALEKVMENQRRLEDECVLMGKTAVQLHQKTVRWKAEYKRFQTQVADLKGFEEWARMTEASMHEISSKLEYVCHYVNKEE